MFNTIYMVINNKPVNFFVCACMHGKWSWIVCVQHSWSKVGKYWRWTNLVNSCIQFSITFILYSSFLKICVHLSSSYPRASPNWITILLTRLRISSHTYLWQRKSSSRWICLCAEIYESFLQMTSFDTLHVLAY